ncbi:hypothetical protein C0991_001880 [Blastosporella zonata]|nr:hypothetical protein C0991_001880 [Blastosporella zonata]
MEVNSGATLDVETGAYSLTWTSATEDVVAGVGWNPGSAQVINYSGTFTTDGNAYLSVYGWTTSPLVEYYILESYAGSPSSGQSPLTVEHTKSTPPPGPTSLPSTEPRPSTNTGPSGSPSASGAPSPLPTTSMHGQPSG